MKTIPIITREGPAETACWQHALQKEMPEFNILSIEQLNKEALFACEVAICANPDPALLAALPNLKWVQSLWAGVERLLSEVSQSSFKIVRMLDPQLAQTMAEAVLTWTLYLHRDIPLYRQQQDNGCWQQHPVNLASETNIGVLGLGSLGKTASQGLIEQGFNVIGWSRTKVDINGANTFTGLDGLETVLQATNILLILLPLTHETHALLNDETLKLLPENASIINFARSAIIDQTALLRQLDSGHLKHAVLDVFDQEPLAPASPYWRHRSITVLPHISAPTNKHTASKIAAQNIRAYFEQNIIPQAVDPLRGY